MIHGFYLGPRLNRAFRHDIELTYEFTVSSRVLLVRKALFDCAPPGKDCILLLFSRPTVCEFSRKPLIGEKLSYIVHLLLREEKKPCKKLKTRPAAAEGFGRPDPKPHAGAFASL